MRREVRERLSDSEDGKIIEGKGREWNIMEDATPGRERKGKGEVKGRGRK